MRVTTHIATVIVTVAVLFMLGLGPAQSYEPEAGDDVVIYVNTFNAADFEQAKQIMVEGFGDAMSASGQTRRTYWIVNAETHEIIGISFFQQGHSVDEWHDHDRRQEVLDQLEPLRSAPLAVQHYQVLDLHKADH